MVRPYFRSNTFLKVFGMARGGRSKEFHPTFKIGFDTPQVNELLKETSLKGGSNP